ncbi:hypothetical protein ACOI1H_14385 [Loktanella sp. DJP18]|uniref:hypothetical protein n=1 Tax=Loktanella sp. DJP18 TaxID=3409788 RepID=UPI003BB5216F
MIRTMKTILWTLAALVAIDLCAALVLAGPAPQGLRNFFEYGRSVPGKIAQWEADPDVPGNLLGVAWLPEMMAESARTAVDRQKNDGPVLHAYSMSFVDRIVRGAQDARPGLRVEIRSGPGASPNFTYAAFLQDRSNRRPGDVAVLGILSSSVSAMGSLTNATWVFEQPAPFTYPIFRPDASDGLTAEMPVLQSLAEQLTLDDNPDLARRWHTQLAAQDLIYTPAAFDLPWLDASPFVRLVRRALAQGGVDQRKARIVAHPEDGPMPYAEVLRRMIMTFDRIARDDGQIPIVVLVQSNRPGDPDLKALLGDFLDSHGYHYFATADHQNPRDPRAFEPDGHYRPAVDSRFGILFLDVLDRASGGIAAQ